MDHSHCPLSFHQLYIHSSGEVYPCGFVQGDLSLGNIQNNSLQEIWEGTLAKNFREMHFNKDQPLCSNRQKLYNCHLMHDDVWNDDKKLSIPKLKRLDIMIDSFCNLKCRMCTNRSEVNGGFISNTFWSELENSILPQLEEIELVGGEPLIIKDTYKLFDLGHKINPNIKWSLTTNGHLEFDTKVKKAFKNLKFRSVAVSIDSLDQKNFKYIRDRGALEKVIDFLDKLIKYKKEESLNFNIVCNFLVQKDNWRELGDFIIFAKEKNIKLYPILLREPEEFSILNFEHDKLLQILDRYIETYRIHRN